MQALAARRRDEAPAPSLAIPRLRAGVRPRHRHGAPRHHRPQPRPRSKPTWQAGDDRVHEFRPVRARRLPGLGVGVAVSTAVVGYAQASGRGTSAVEAGEYTSPSPIHTNDEIGQLAVAFNRMVERTARQGAHQGHFRQVSSIRASSPVSLKTTPLRLTTPTARSSPSSFPTSPASPRSASSSPRRRWSIC